MEARTRGGRGIGWRRAAALAAVCLPLGCAAARSAGAPVAQAVESEPVEPQPVEVSVTLERDGLAELLREHYLGAWVAVRPPGQFVKDVYRMEVPATEQQTYLCRVGSDYIGVCGTPPEGEMRSYPLSQVQFTFTDFCERTGRCRPPPR